MEPARTLGVVGARLQAIGRVDVAPVVDAVATQPIRRHGSRWWCTPFRGVGLTDPIQPWSGATLADRVADLTTVAVIIGRALNAAAVRAADQAVAALVVIATRYAVVAAADGATRAIERADSKTGVRVSIAR